MNTFLYFLKNLQSVPMVTTWELASRNWHTGSHDAWPYINYLLFTLKNVYKEFESRFANTQAPTMPDGNFMWCI